MPQDKAKKYMDQTSYIIQELSAAKRLNKTHKKIIKKIEQTMTRFGYKSITV